MENRFSVLLSVVLSIFITRVSANEKIIDVLEKAHSVFTPHPHSLSLKQAKEYAVGENIDILIAYENLYQCQKKISQARASFFPYGVGDLLILNYTSTFNTLILIELTTSIPSKWYNLKKLKHLKNAQFYNTVALRRNIKNQVSNMYYTILKEQSLMKLTALELVLMEKLLKVVIAKVRLGLENKEELFKLENRILRQRLEYLDFEDYLTQEVQAFKTLLNLPYGSSFNLKPNAKFFTDKDINLDRDKMTKEALINSYEIKAAQEIVNASYDSKVSSKWSILSFGGIGFGYLSKIRNENSKIKDALYRKNQTKNNIYNNTFTRISIFSSSVELFLYEKDIAFETKNIMLATMAAYNAGKADLAKLIETQLLYLRDFKELVSSHYNAFARFEDLKRAVTAY